MSESGSRAGRLEALRSAGAERLDPLRLRYLQALLHRLQAQPDAVRRILECKVDAALVDLEQRVRAMHEGGTRPAARQSIGSPLARLNEYARAAGQLGGEDDRQASDRDGWAETRSVRQFRQAWSRIAADEQVDRAVQRGPEGAGPLNSHMLVLRSLELMRTLSPEYLRRFLSQVDTLLWLDAAGQRHVVADATAGRRSRRK